MIKFSHGSTTIAILLLAATAYGQCEYNIRSIMVHGRIITNILCMCVLKLHMGADELNMGLILQKFVYKYI